MRRSRSQTKVRTSTFSKIEIKQIKQLENRFSAWGKMKLRVLDAVQRCKKEIEEKALEAL